MKILVTGASGFVGNHVIENLLKKDHLIIASSKNHEKAKSMAWHQKVEYIQHTIGQSLDDNMKDHLRNVDVCIHLAWDGLPDFRSELHTTSYLSNHYNFLKELIELGIPKLAVVGTCLEYGLQEGELKEDLPANPIIAYASGKDQLRKQLQELQRIIPFELDWIRLFYMFGEGQHPKSILPQLEQAIKKGESTFKMSKGDQQRDYSDVKEIAEKIIHLACLTKGSGIVNCCSGRPIRIIDLVEGYVRSKNARIGLQTGYYESPDYEPKAFWGSTKKMNRLLHD